MIKINELPASIRGVVKKFCKDNNHLATSVGANGKCTWATNLFYQILIENHGWDYQWLDVGHETSSWWWKGSVHPWDSSLGKLDRDIGPMAPHNYYYNNGWPGHVCVSVSEKTWDRGGWTYFIDFTARQYDSNAPFPLVWRKRWSYDIT